MPMPVSRTSTCSWPFCRATDTSMLPCGRLYSIALCSRLVSTSRSLSGSASNWAPSPPWTRSSEAAAPRPTAAPAPRTVPPTLPHRLARAAWYRRRHRAAPAPADVRRLRFICWPLSRQSSSISRYSSAVRGLRRASSVVVSSAASGVAQFMRDVRGRLLFAANARCNWASVFVNRSTMGRNSEGNRRVLNCRRKSFSDTRLTASDSRRNGSKPSQTSSQVPATAAANVIAHRRTRLVRSVRSDSLVSSFKAVNSASRRSANPRRVASRMLVS